MLIAFADVELPFHLLHILLQLINFLNVHPLGLLLLPLSDDEVYLFDQLNYIHHRRLIGF